MALTDLVFHRPVDPAVGNRWVLAPASLITDRSQVPHVLPSEPRAVDVFPASQWKVVQVYITPLPAGWRPNPADPSLWVDGGFATFTEVWFAILTGHPWMFFSLQTMIMNRFVTQAVRSVPNDSGQYNPLYFHRPKVGNRDWIVSPTKLTASSATKATVRAEHWDVPCVLGQPDLPLPACTGPLFESFTQFLFPISVYISSRGLGWLRFAEDELFDNGFLRKL